MRKAGIVFFILLAITSGAVYSEARAGIQEDATLLSSDLSLNQTFREDLVQMLEEKTKEIRLDSKSSYDLYGYEGFQTGTTLSGRKQTSILDKSFFIQMLKDPNREWKSRVFVDGRYRLKLKLWSESINYGMLDATLVLERVDLFSKF